MANTDSAKKYIKVSAKKQAENNAWHTKLKNLGRKFQKAVKEKKKDAAQAVYKDLQKVLDAAAKRNVIHKNAAARKKSRLSAALKKL